MTYTFVLINASQDVTFNCNAVTDSMVGTVTILDDEGTTNSRAASANGGTHDSCLLDVSAGGSTMQIGAWVRFSALTTTLWFVEGQVVGTNGAQAHVVFSST
jgi:hypothetical protein